jgi:hypothetical protein
MDDLAETRGRDLVQRIRRGDGEAFRGLRALLPERDVARAPRSTTTVPRGGDRAGSVLGGVAEPGRVRPAAGVGPRVVDGHGPSTTPSTPCAARSPSAGGRRSHRSRTP